MKNLTKLEKAISEIKGKSNAKDLVRSFRAIMRTAHYTGSGRFTSLSDCTEEASSLLNDLGISHVINNDAPQGGKIGNHIIITDKVYFKLAQNKLRAGLKEEYGTCDMRVISKIKKQNKITGEIQQAQKREIYLKNYNNVRSWIEENQDILKKDFSISKRKNSFLIAEEIKDNFVGIKFSHIAEAVRFYL